MTKSKLDIFNQKLDYYYEELERNFDILLTFPRQKLTCKDLFRKDLDIFGDGTLRKTVIKEGIIGTQLHSGEIYVINYSGNFENGQVFEKYYDFEIRLGDLDITQGIDIVLPLMCIGEIAEVYVDPKFAYGKDKTEIIPPISMPSNCMLDSKPPNSALTNSIPPNCSIIYTIELKLVELESEIETLSITDRIKKGKKKIAHAEKWWDRSNMFNAKICFQKAIRYLSPTIGTSLFLPYDNISFDEKHGLIKQYVIAHTGLSEVLYIANKDYDAALAHIDLALRFLPQNSKAKFIKGMILKFKKDYASAYNILTKLHNDHPHYIGLIEEIGKLDILIQIEQDKKKYKYHYDKGIIKQNNADNINNIEEENHCKDKKKQKEINDNNNVVRGMKISKKILWNLSIGVSFIIFSVILRKCI